MSSHKESVDSEDIIRSMRSPTVTKTSTIYKLTEVPDKCACFES